MDRRRVLALNHSFPATAVRRTAAPVEPSYAPWEFWAHLALLVLVPVTLGVASQAQALRARGQQAPNFPARATTNEAPHDREVCAGSADGRCEKAER
jgi:hypothetical protein